ncbi:hypothetical protein [Methylocystis sp. SC2]|uniref:hypothetical protein n=1 Tax=Methylocystis sp. (strain SC2) TaxID=187303 RepID=UPI00027AED2A|nr:hypothetical protein [Methylocystis sp. SC2]CCJ05749.1 Putative membrane-associated oxidoreductase [Methylocystis sp. SC2]
MAKMAKGRSLEEFHGPGSIAARMAGDQTSGPIHLHPGEWKLLNACRMGGVCTLGIDNIIRADFLRFLLLGGDKDAPVHELGVQIEGASIVGQLILRGAALPNKIALRQCRVDGKIDLRGANARTINLEGSSIAGLDGEHLELRGDLILRNAQITDCLYLPGAKIAHDLDCRGGEFIGPHGPAINCEGITIGGSALLGESCRASGSVNFNSAKIVGDFDCSGGSFQSGYGPALAISGAEIGGCAKLRDDFSAEGVVELVSARIEGHLECTKGRFNNPNGYALVFDGSQIEAVVFLDRGFRANGVVRAHGARIKGDLHCEGGSFTGAPMKEFIERNNDGTCFALSLNKARVEGKFFLQKCTISGNISLAHTHVGVLHDNSPTIESFYSKIHGKTTLNSLRKQFSRNPEYFKIHEAAASRFYLDGFTYDRLDCAAPHDCESRLKWLYSQPNELLLKEKFRAQPWIQLIKVLQAMGHKEAAKQIAIEKQKHLRSIGKIGDPIISAFHDFYHIFMDYGHRPWKLVKWTVGIWLLCAGIYFLAWKEQLIVPATPIVASDHNLPGKANTSFDEFNPLFYSLDLLLPIGGLDQAKNWKPAVGAAILNEKCRQFTVASVLPHSSGPESTETCNAQVSGNKRDLARRKNLVLLLRYVTSMEHLFGWAASLLLVASLTGLVKKDS